MDKLAATGSGGYEAVSDQFPGGSEVFEAMGEEFRNHADCNLQSHVVETTDYDLGHEKASLVLGNVENIGQNVDQVECGNGSTGLPGGNRVELPNFTSYFEGGSSDVLSPHFFIPDIFAAQAPEIAVDPFFDSKKSACNQPSSRLPSLQRASFISPLKSLGVGLAKDKGENSPTPRPPLADISNSKIAAPPAFSRPETAIKKSLLKRKGENVCFFIFSIYIFRVK